MKPTELESTDVYSYKYKAILAITFLFIELRFPYSPTRQHLTCFPHMKRRLSEAGYWKLDVNKEAEKRGRDEQMNKMQKKGRYGKQADVRLSASLFSIIPSILCVASHEESSSLYTVFYKGMSVHQFMSKVFLQSWGMGCKCISSAFYISLEIYRTVNYECRVM